VTVVATRCGAGRTRRPGWARAADQRRDRAWGFDVEVLSDAVSALFTRIGPGILVTHSQGGGPGWVTAIKNRQVHAVVSYAPGSGFVFPNGEVPPPLPSSGGTLEAVGVPLSDFLSLTKIPILIVYGDNIPAEPMPVPSQDEWRVRLAMSRRWADAVNRRGGDVTVVHLPEAGIRGNTHFPFSDLNNLEIAIGSSQTMTEPAADPISALRSRRHAAGGRPTSRLNARANAASES
jgi:hypothetical protein